MIKETIQLKLFSNKDISSEVLNLWKLKYSEHTCTGELILSNSLTENGINTNSITTSLNNSLKLDLDVSFKNNDQLFLLISLPSGFGTSLGFRFKDGNWQRHNNMIEMLFGND